jgi:hypothetical protein
MQVEQAAAGHASNLDGLSAVMDLRMFNIQGVGCLRIDEGCHPPRMKWDVDRHTGLNFGSQEDAKLGKTVRSMEAFKDETVALSGPDLSIFDGGRREDHGGNLDSGLHEKAEDASTRYDAYIARMKLLRQEASHDGYALNLASEIDFLQFIQSASAIRKGNLVLMDNGNLRAIWKDAQGTHLGLQFLGGRMVQYVIFKRRMNGQHFSRVAGRDSLEGLERQIDAFGLHSLLY